MGKSKSLDTDEPPSSGSGPGTADPSDIFKNCQNQHPAENNCNNCSDRDKTRDLELNKVSFHILHFLKNMFLL